MALHVKLGKKLDTRGLGGYVLLPPSVHPSGAIYTWTNTAPPAPAPAWLTQLLKMQPATREAAPRLKSSCRPAKGTVVERAIAYVAQMPAAISGQHGHDATFRVARVLRGFGLSEDQALAILLKDYNTRCVPPWSKHELVHKVREAFKKAKHVPAIRSSERGAS